MNIEKFLSNKAKGSFDTSEEYQNWKIWSNKICDCLYEINENNKYKSSLPKDEEFIEIWSYIEQNIESSIHVLTHDMMETGASWVHLRILHKMCPEYKINKQHSGMFYLLISDWLQYYCKLQGQE